MKINLYQVDAFTDKLFGGNPAAVCPLTYWLSKELMQKIAQENNLSETAFFIKTGQHYEIRWFTPKTEVDLCGHATLATAFVIFNYIDNNIDTISFKSRSGELIVTRNENLFVLDFPIINAKKYSPDEKLLQLFPFEIVEFFKGTDFMIVLESEEQVRLFQPNFSLIEQLPSRGLIITSPGKTVDFVSRWFGPQVGVNEDPVTGSAHCMLAPYWAHRLNKSRLYAEQLSERLGKIHCEVKNGRVFLTGQAVLYMKGEIEFNDLSTGS